VTTTGENLIFDDDDDDDDDSMLSGSLVTTVWRVLRLRMEEKASRYGGQLRIY
jgi:hypothetical protein